MALDKNMKETIRKWAGEKDSDVTPDSMTRKTRAGTRFAVLLLLDVLDRLDDLEVAVQKGSKKNP